MKLSIYSEAVLLRCTKIFIYLIPLLPLFVTPSIIYPYVAGKNFAFRIIIQMASAFWIVLIIRNKGYRPCNAPIALSVLIFTFIVGVADLFGINPYKSFWSNYERMEGYITILHLTLYFIIIKSIFRTEKDWKIFFSIIVVVSAFVSIFIFLETLLFTHSLNYVEEYGTRGASTIGNPPFLASYLLLAVFLGVLLMLMTQINYLKLLCFFSVIINLFVIYVTSSRGAIIAAIAGAIIMSMLFIHDKLKGPDKINFKKTFPVVLILLIVLSASYMAYNNLDLLKKDRTFSRFILLFSDDPSVRTRIVAWKMALNGIKENPFLGWGQENFIGVYTVNPIDIGDKLTWVDRAHNVILDWLVNAGILGLCAYLAIFGAAFYNLWRHFQNKTISVNETRVIVMMILVYFIQNLFTFDSINTYILFFTLLAYIDNLHIIKSDVYIYAVNISPSVSNNMKLMGKSIAALIVVMLIGFFTSYIPLKQLFLYSKISMSLSQYDSFTKMHNDFNKALSYRAFGNNDIRNQMADVSRQLLESDNLYQKGALELIQTTAQEMEKGIASEQYNLEYIYNAIGFYELLASYKSSFISFVEVLIEKCLKINPEFTRIDFSKVNLYFLKKDYENAYSKLKEFVDQYPNNAGWQYQVALAAILTSRDDEVERALGNVKNLRRARSNDIASGIKPVFTIKQLNKLAQTYLEVMNYKQAQKYYNEIIFNLSNYNEIRLAKGYIQTLTDEDKTKLKAKMHLEVAEIYILLNDTEKARVEVEIAGQLDPTILTVEKEKIINQLNN